MSDKLAYIYACSVLEKLCLFCKHKRGIWPPLFFSSYGNPCKSHSPSTNTKRSDILLKKRTHNTFKSDDKCSPEKHKHWHEWLSSSGKR